MCVLRLQKFWEYFCGVLSHSLQRQHNKQDRFTSIETRFSLSCRLTYMPRKNSHQIYITLTVCYGQLFKAYELPFSQLQVWEISAKWNSDSVKQGKNRCTFLHISYKITTSQQVNSHLLNLLCYIHYVQLTKSILSCKNKI